MTPEERAERVEVWSETETGVALPPGVEAKIAAEIREAVAERISETGIPRAICASLERIAAGEDIRVVEEDYGWPEGTLAPCTDIRERGQP